MEGKIIAWVIVCVAIIVAALVGAKHFYDSATELQNKIDQQTTQYAQYKDSVESVQSKLSKELDSVKTVKDKVQIRIKNVPVYVNSLTKESDSTIATKMDSVFRANLETGVPNKDSVFKPTALTIHNSDSTAVSGIFVHKLLGVDYLATYDLMNSYKSLSLLNQKESNLWAGKYVLEKALFDSSESYTKVVKGEYVKLIDSQKQEIRLYRSVTVGAAAASGAALLNEKLPTVAAAGVVGFVVSYFYDTVKGIF